MREHIPKSTGAHHPEGFGPLQIRRVFKDAAVIDPNYNPNYQAQKTEITARLCSVKIDPARVATEGHSNSFVGGANSSVGVALSGHPTIVSRTAIGNRQAALYNGAGGQPTILEVKKLGCVRGDRRLFSGLDLSVSPGTLVQLTGPNGSGKTSLLRILCGLLPAAEGSVNWNGANIRSLGEEYFTSVTYLGHRHGVKDELSAVENLQISNALNGVSVSKERARTVLEQMGLAGRELLPARLLSEGQRRRVALARLLVCNTKLWLLDEVLTSLDKGAVALVRSLIEKHLLDGGIAIVATHQELDLPAGLTRRLELTT